METESTLRFSLNDLESLPVLNTWRRHFWQNCDQSSCGHHLTSEPHTGMKYFYSHSLIRLFFKTDCVMFVTHGLFLPWMFLQPLALLQSIKHHQANAMPSSVPWFLMQMTLQGQGELGSPVLCIVTCHSICMGCFQRPLCLQGKLRLEMISELKSQPREVIGLQNPQS